MGTLDRQVAIVTGGGAGIGRAIASELAKEGARLSVAEIDPARAAEAAEELAALGVEARGYATDVSDCAQVEATIDAVVRDFGRLAAYLCSPAAEYVNGACITIDGGLTAIPAG